jgi:hypothetical protein
VDDRAIGQPCSIEMPIDGPSRDLSTNGTNSPISRYGL